VTEDGWTKFHERIALAKKDLERAYELAPKLPHAAAALVTVAMAESDEKASKAWFEKAVRADPRYQPAYEHRLTHLEPKWGGSEEEVFAFAREHGKKDPALALLIVHLHFATADCSGRRDAYVKDAAVKSEIEDALARYAKAFPRCPNGYVAKVAFAGRLHDVKGQVAAHEEGARFDAGMAIVAQHAARND